MDHKEQITALRAQGLTPKEIARRLGLRPAQVNDAIRLAAQPGAKAAEVAPAKVVACLVNPGWSSGLIVDGAPPEWREERPFEGGSRGLVSVLVAREHRYGKVQVCGYLVDVFCLGVKNTIGPKVMEQHELKEFARRYFSATDVEPILVPLPLVQALVLGAADYARKLGFEPHRDFAQSRPFLGDFTGENPITFGDGGRPHFINGPDDNVDVICNMLNLTAGRGKYDTTLLG